MPRLFARILTTAVLASLALPALADRDIVFAARYYARPGVHKTTSFHLYRINPSGSGRTQLTDGDHDDKAPRWSPDGRWIAFTRDENKLCVIRAEGGPVRVLASSTFNAEKFKGSYVNFGVAVWLSDSRQMILPNGASGAPSQLISVPGGRNEAFKDTLIDAVPSPYDDRIYAKGGNGVSYIASPSHHESRRVTLSGDINHAAWLSPDTIVGSVESEGDASDRFTAYDTKSGKKLWDRKIIVTQTNSDMGIAFRGTFTIPGDTHHIVLANDISNSTIRPSNEYYRVDIKTGKATLWISDAQLFAFSPSGRYITSSARTLSDYGPKRNGYQRGVWTADLSIGASPSDSKPRVIVRGLVWVIGADWRK